jgi:hypothetical protein
MKKPSIGDLVDKSMEGRNFDGGSERAEDRKPRTRFKPSPKQAVMIRLDDGDYGILQRIAERKGLPNSSNPAWTKYAPLRRGGMDASIFFYRSALDHGERAAPPPVSGLYRVCGGSRCTGEQYRPPNRSRRSAISLR